MRTTALLLALCTQGVYAQSWFNDEAEWHFAYSNSGAVIGYVHGTIGGDTLLDGQAARKLELHRYASTVGSTQVFEEAVQDWVVHYANGVVWGYVPHRSAFDTLYNMLAVPGDRWHLAELNEPACGPESYMEVTDTGTTTRYGPELRWLAVDVYYFGDWTNGVLHDTIVERIGTLGMYLHPRDYCLAMLDGSEGGRPLCYRDTEVTYQWDPEIPCDRALDLGGQTTTPALSLHPNPASDQVNIRGTPVLSAASLTDLTGRLVHSWQLVPGENTLNTASIPPGGYVLRVVDNHVVRSMPLLIQR